MARLYHQALRDAPLRLWEWQAIVVARRVLTRASPARPHALALLVFAFGCAFIATAQLQPGAPCAKWAFDASAPVYESRSMGADETLYICSYGYPGGGVLYAIDRSYARSKWQFTCLDSAPAVGANGLLYVGNYDRPYAIYALNASNGDVVWSYDLMALVYRSPALDDYGVVYVGSDDGVVRAFNATTGELKWAHTTGDKVEAVPTINANGVLYIGSGDHRMYALNSSIGAVIWKYRTDDTTPSTVALGKDGAIYFGSIHTQLFALNGSTGALIWSYTADSDADGAVYLYTGLWDAKVCVLDGRSGSLIWMYRTGEVEYSSPVIGADGTVYVGSLDNSVYALDGRTGALKWSFATVNDSAIGADGTLYVASEDGLPYALSQSTA